MSDESQIREVEQECAEQKVVNAYLAEKGIVIKSDFETDIPDPLAQLKEKSYENLGEFSWGTFKGNEEYVWRELDKHSTTHLENILITQSMISQVLKSAIIMILRDRWKGN